MAKKQKSLHFTRHAKAQMILRNTNEEEVTQAIRNAKWQTAEKGRLNASMSFPFNKKHYGRFYATKEIVPIFIEETDRIVVITVYTFFSQKGGR